MTGRTPSRLPTAFVRVSRCPICRYSLKDLDEQCPCPECGEQIDRALLHAPSYTGPVSETRFWCALGAAGWLIIGSTILVLTLSGLRSVGVISVGGLLMLIIISFPFLSAFSLLRKGRLARIDTYRALKKAPSGKVQVPMSVVVLATIGMLIGVVCIGALIKSIGSLA